ncbi:MAG: hypothetical protein IT459_07405 [Planctomycetes bacterium]|nr:hypothetical protein [Planctomycetota bacterium]
MTSPPAIAGLEILAEMGRDRFVRRFRLGGRDARHLVLLDGLDAAASGDVLTTARRFVGTSVRGVAPLLDIVQHDGGAGFVIGVEPGESLWRTFGVGELATLPVLRTLAEAVARLHARGLAHGALLAEAALVRDASGDPYVLPPVVAPESLPAVGRSVGRPESESDSYATLPLVARDLSALAQFACQWISGARPELAAGVGIVPESVQMLASPATAQALRLVFDLASKNPTAAASRELLERIGWASDLADAPVAKPAPVAVAPTRAAVRKPEASPAPAAVAAASGPSANVGTPAASAAVSNPTGDASGSPRRRPAREPAPKKTRIPLILGPIAVAAIGAVLYVMGGDKAVDEYANAPRGTTDATSANHSAPPVSLPKPAPPTPVEEAPVDADAAAEAERVIQALKAKKEGKVEPAKPTYDRTLIDAGDKLKAEGTAILNDLREKKIPFEQTGAKIDEAIQKLEAARDEYVKFGEQYESRARLVEKSIEDVNSLLYFAYRNRKTLGKK